VDIIHQQVQSQASEAMNTNNAPEGIVKPSEDGAVLNPLCTRRQTLIWGGSTIIGLSALKPLFAGDGDQPLFIMEKAQGMIIADPVLCVGCGRCELACTEFNDGRAAPSQSRIKVDRNLNFGPQGATVWREGHGNLGDGLIVQDLCRQCPHPVPCANICPEHAIMVSPGTRARVIDPAKCTGCRICLQACPWEMISFDPDTRKATKCHLCQGKPKCVEACPAGSLRYVPWQDLTGKIPRRNLNATLIPTQRAAGCQECHLPAQPRNLGLLNAMLQGALQGRPSPPAGRIGFSWIDMAGAMLVPLALGSVLVHAVLRKVKKR
jgi:Fe-S-cluster-containing dehydrogenase component